VVLWPVVVDQLSGSGNLGAIVDYLGRPGRTRAGWAEALGLVGRQLAPWGPWIGGREPSSTFGGASLAAPVWWLWVPLTGTALAVASAWRTRDTTMLRLLALVVVACVVGLVSVASITPPVYPYLLVWFRVLAALVWGAVALTVGRALARARRPASGTVDEPGEAPVEGRRSGRVGKVLVVGAVALLALVPAGVATVSQARAPLPYAEAARAADALLPTARAAVEPGAAFALSSNSPFSRVVESIGTELVQDGRRIVVDEEHALAWGAFRQGDVDDPSIVRLAVVVPSKSGAIEVPEGWAQLARWDPPAGGAGDPMVLAVRTEEG
jgi:hypothetical protein